LIFVHTAQLENLGSHRLPVHRITVIADVYWHINRFKHYLADDCKGPVRLERILWNQAARREWLVAQCGGKSVNLDGYLFNV
jgi:hypothetical protein